jgi:hypothetical protein
MHALNLMDFEKLPRKLTLDLLDRAFASCFVQDEENASAGNAEIVRPDIQTCVEYWRERTDGIGSALGRLAFFAAFCDRNTNSYRDPASEAEYSPAEVSAVLAQLHMKAFREWLRLTLEQQRDDLANYVSTPEGQSALLSFDRREFANMLVPLSAKAEEAAFFRNDLGTILMLLFQRSTAPATPEQTEIRLEKIA